MQEGGNSEPKKKVCYIITKGLWGGAQKYVYLLSTELPKDKYDVFVITGEGEVLKEKLEEKGIRTYVLKNLKRNMSVVSEIQSFFALLKIIWKEKPDVLHLNSPKAGGIGSVIGRLLFRKKIIFTAHGWTFNEERPLYQNVLILLFSWITILLCHKTIVIAPREEEQAKEMPLINDKKIILIRNGVENIKFKDRETAKKTLLKKIDRDNDGNVLWIGTIAELHKNKGLEYAITAVSRIQTPFKYFIIGEGEERKNLQKLIERLGLENKVFLVGFMDKASDYLKAFDIFMLTSIKEGLPYVVLEAGLAELPIIASSVGGIPDIIENGISGILTTSTRTGEIVRALEYMIEKPEQRKNFGLRLEEKIRKDFSVDKMVEKTLALYS